MKSEWADYTAVQADCGNLSGNKLTRISSGNTRPQSSQLTEPLWSDPGLKSGINVAQANLHLKKKKMQVGNELSNILPKILAPEEKAATTTFSNSCNNIVIIVCDCWTWTTNGHELLCMHW